MREKRGQLGLRRLAGWMAFTATLAAAAPTFSQAPGRIEERPLKLETPHWLTEVYASQPDPDGEQVDMHYPDRSVHLIVNRRKGTYYGYELFEERTAETLTLRFAPLSSFFVARWLESGWNSVCPGCATPTRVAFDTTDQLPPGPITVRSGDSYQLAFSLDPVSGSRYVETFRFTAMTAAPASRVRMELALLTMNNEPRTNLASCEGEVVYFFVGARGRYLASATPRDGFQPVGVVNGNQLEFAWGKNQFRWLSSGPIVRLPGMPDDATVKTRLWIGYEPEWSSPMAPDPGTYGTGVLTEAGAVDNSRFAVP